MVNPKPAAAFRSPHQRGMIIANTQQPQLLQAGSEKEEVQFGKLQVRRQTWVMTAANAPKKKRWESPNKHSLRQRRDVLEPTQKTFNHFWQYAPVLQIWDLGGRGESQKEN